MSRIRFFQGDDSGSSRIFQANWPWPTSTAKTLLAPFWSRQSVKAAGRRPDIERGPALANNSKVLDRAFKLDPAASNVTTAGRDRNLMLLLDQIRWLGCDVPVDSDFASHNRRLRLMAACEKPALNERLIESDSFCHDSIRSLQRIPTVACPADNDLNGLVKDV